MYSVSAGLKSLRTFDAWFGAHQRLDRFALRQLKTLVTVDQLAAFPKAKQLMEFEGINGPDGIKIKTPAQGEPWHFYNPYDSGDTQILDIMRGHYKTLVTALKKGNATRASFEAAWLAHAIVDGLTPAHHYPYENELLRLRGGEGIHTRKGLKDKIVMPGETMFEKFKNNWAMVGDKGLLSTHMAFEFGVAVLIVPMRSTRKKSLNAAELKLASSKDGFIKYFQKQAKDIADLNLYKTYYQLGWTPGMVRRVRSQMAPMIVNTVTLAWYAAIVEASK